MRYFVCLFFSLLSFLSLQTNLNAQDIRNVEVVTSDEKLIITYDLFGKKDASYQVDILFKSKDGSEIRPKALIGDVGKNVNSGEAKTIIWDVYKDVDELKGTIEPVLKATETKASIKSNEKKNVANRIPNKQKNKRFKTGFKIGTGNSSAIVNTDPNKYEKGQGFEGGMIFRWNVNKRFFVQPEVLYRRQSYKFDSVVSLSGDLVKSTHNNQYGKGQLMLGLSPFKGGIYLNGGPYVAYLLGAKQKFENGDAVVDVLVSSTEMNGQEYPLNRLDYGYNIGGSLDFGRGGFVFGILYSEGLNNVNNQAYFAENQEGNNLELRNRSINFYITIGF